MNTDRQAQGMENLMLGRWGEALVAEDLRRRGLEVLGYRYHCRMGEIDLIARDKGYIIFFEVKLRKSDAYGAAAEAVTAAKRARLRKTAEHYLAHHPNRLQPRFDVAEVYAPQGARTRRPRITYIENAF